MILILAVGQKQPAWVNDGVADYLARFPAAERPTLKEIKAEPRTNNKNVATIMTAEASRIEAAIPKNTTRIALDERGEAITTEAFSLMLEKLQQKSANIAFIIGGPDGLNSDFKTACQ